MTIRAMVVDDSTLFRRVMTEALAAVPGVEVVGSAANGKLALQRVRELKPDLLTLDLEMPEMDGLAVLDALKQSGEPVTVIVVSALTKRGGQLTMRALAKGAFDFITKPDAGNAKQSLELLRAELAPRIGVLARRLEIRSILRAKPAASAPPPPTTSPAPAQHTPSLQDVGARMNRLAAPGRPEMVLIGVSTGGPNALGRLLPDMPAGLGVPLFIVQHMPPGFTQTLAETLDAKCALRVREAVDGESAQPDIAYIAPGGRHMRLKPGPGPEATKIIDITDDPPENNCRPSVDYLFRSVATHFPGRSMALIMTGMGNDGTLGLRLLKRSGCTVLAQDEASCVVYGMPKAAVEAGVVDTVLPLEAMAGRVVAALRRGRS